MNISLETLNNYFENHYKFICTRQTIKNQSLDIEVAINRVWGLEVFPSFSNHFCFAVYESNEYSVISMLIEKKSLSEYSQDIDIKDFLDNPDKYSRIRDKSDFIFEQVVVSSSYISDIGKALTKINLSFSKKNYLAMDGTSYLFKVRLNQEELNLSFHSAALTKYKKLLATCANTIKHVCQNSSSPLVKNRISEWINTF
ncbi:hypothetical protein [Candidatus Uabimicrobium sp. HlEnr_7]|uniref:hypothetical protein n=1 Tax=Candidatus Uabimicrobium helgolandensis TaxID=3095367 RepID=UPI0035575C41